MKTKTFNFGANHLISDIKKLGWRQQLFISAVFIFFIVNSVLNWDYWQLLSIGASVTSILNVIMIANKRLSNFFWGILSTLTYGVYAWHTGYVGDSVLNFAWYLPLAIIGYYFWLKKMDDKKDIVIKRKWQWKYTPYLVIGFGATFVIWLFLIPQIAKLSGGYSFNLYSWQHILDTTTNTLGVVSTILMQARMGIENIAYIISNPMNIAMWSIMYDLNMIIVYSIYLMVSFIGIYKWYDLDKIMKGIKWANI